MMKDLLSILGFLLAGFCFFVWYGGRGGSPTTDIHQSRITESTLDRSETLAAPQPLERPAGVSDSNNRRIKIETAPEKVTTSTGISTEKIKNQVQQLAEVATSYALDYQVPAGASLALLIYSAERGKQVNKSNLHQVIEYLLGVKESADEQDRQRYFKYASNSEKWFQGLGLARNGGHPQSDLVRIYNAYGLSNFDQKVYAFVTSPAVAEKSRLKFDKKIEPATVAPSLSGNASNEELRRNHAFAKNRWAEQEAKGTAAEVKFLPAEKRSGQHNIRQKLEKLAIGQSLTFSDPNDYHAAVKEMIALEAGLDSWTDYEAKAGKAGAEKYFRKRVEQGGFLATGTLKVTRER